MNRFPLTAALILATSSVAAQELSVVDAYVPQSPPGAMSQAAYMRLKNTTGKTRSLIGIEAEGYAMAHLHSSETKNGVATMAMVHQLDIAPGQSVSLEPGGLHIMLMRPEMMPKVGDTIDLKLLFANGETLEVPVEVKPRQQGS